MTKIVGAAAIAAMVMSAVPAAAQAPKAEPQWFIGVEGGAQAVQNVGGLGGVQLGRHLSSRLDVFGEAVYLQDIATRRRQQSAEGVAAYMAQTQGTTAAGSITIPTWVFDAGVRYFLTSGHGLRPYIVGLAGAGRATLRPAFTLGGADVTTSLGQYGVTLGSDLTGTATKPAFGGGFGVATTLGAWDIDAAVRLFSIQLDGQAANSPSVSFGLARTF